MKAAGNHQSFTTSLMIPVFHINTNYVPLLLSQALTTTKLDVNIRS